MGTNNVLTHLTDNVIKLYRDRQVSFNGELCGPKYCNIGLPQGLTLSPILFNLYTADFHKIKNNGVQIIQYADHIRILVAEKSLGLLKDKVSIVSDLVINCLKENNFEFSLHKTQAMFVVSAISLAKKLL